MKGCTMCSPFLLRYFQICYFYKMVNDRLHHFINVLGMNPSAFAESVDTNAAVIFNIVKGRRSKPSFDLLEKIFNR